MGNQRFLKLSENEDSFDRVPSITAVVYMVFFS